MLVLVLAYYGSHNFYYFHYFHWSGWTARGQAVTLSHVTLARRHVWRDILLHVSRVTCGSRV